MPLTTLPDASIRREAMFFSPEAKTIIDGALWGPALRVVSRW